MWIYFNYFLVYQIQIYWILDQKFQFYIWYVYSTWQFKKHINISFDIGGLWEKSCTFFSNINGKDNLD